MPELAVSQTHLSFAPNTNEDARDSRLNTGRVHTVISRFDLLALINDEDSTQCKYSIILIRRILIQQKKSRKRLITALPDYLAIWKKTISDWSFSSTVHWFRSIDNFSTISLFHFFFTRHHDCISGISNGIANHWARQFTIVLEKIGNSSL